MNERNPFQNQEPGFVADEVAVGNGQGDFRRLPDDYWYRVASSISERGGETVSPISLRAHAIVQAFGIPSGQSSSLEFRADGSRDTVSERIFSAHVCNPSGLETPVKGIPVTSSRDLSLAGEPELLGIMDPRSAAIVEADRRDAEALPQEYSPMLYFRMPGGVDVFLKGYTHSDEAQARRGVSCGN